MAKKRRRLDAAGGKEAAGTDAEAVEGQGDAAESVYLRGRYTKLSRNMPQSPWIIEGERKGEGSVEEAICGPAKRLFQAADCRFHAEGREDIDVRMLGAGRPFVIEVRGPACASVPPSELEAAVSAESCGAVRVHGLAPCAAAAMAALQRDAENHRKTYIAICWSPRPLQDADVAALQAHRDLEVLQKTPVRVLHRRAQAVRPRTVFWMEAKVFKERYLRLKVNTQAGTYVKEFVHGDLGRTRPSLRDLLGGCKVEILQLDVEGVEDGGDEEIADEVAPESAVQEARGEGGGSGDAAPPGECSAAPAVPT